VPSDSGSDRLSELSDGARKVAVGYLAAVEYMEGWLGRARFIDLQTFRNRLSLMRGCALGGFPGGKGLKGRGKVRHIGKGGLGKGVRKMRN
jgi:hypothetical protein